MFDTDRMVSVKFQNGEEGFLRNLDRANLLHALLTFLLFFEKFALTGDVTAVTFRCNIFTDSLDCLAGNDFSSDCSLYGNIELLTRNKFFQFLAHATSESHGVVGVSQS